MLIRALLVLSYIFWCCRLRAAPWKFFQLNADYFNDQRHIFSKLDMDRLIPYQWRLPQYVDKPGTEPPRYPVFIKPEWGQNSRGVCRIDSCQQLKQHRLQRKANGPRYLVQEAAKQQREFEIFYVPAAKRSNSSAIISVTETCNSTDDDMPVNGIYNKNTSYISCMPDLSSQQLDKITTLFSSMGQFKIARYCARAESIDALVAGEFSIVEINVYVPMPLILLADNVRIMSKLTFLFRCMKQLAMVTKDIPVTQTVKPVFLQKLQSAKLLKASIKNELL